jgi:protein-tyrosine phosphatase
MSETHVGRIDVHSHLLPGIDDGCPNVEESIACAHELVAAGYTHSFCTPHIWPNLPHNTVEAIAERTAELQKAFIAAGVPLRLMPGGELNLRADLVHLAKEQIPTYGMAGRYCIFDIWVDRLPPFFWKTIEWLQSKELKVILAHPERMRAVQDAPELGREFTDRGLLLQGNLQCLGDPPQTHTRQVAERFLGEGLYFVIGSDTHNVAGLPVRLKGLARAVEAVGEAEVWRLTRDNPRQLM